MSNFVKPQNEMENDGYRAQNDGYGDSSLELGTRRFTYLELQGITNNLQRVLGKGGFGYVYDGYLGDGTHVAVKIRSQSSNQGHKEFLAEVSLFSRACIFFLSLASLLFLGPQNSIAIMLSEHV